MTWREKLVLGALVWGMAPILYGVTVSWLWGWFAVPMGAPGVSVAGGYGLGLLGKVIVGVRTEQETRTLGQNSVRIFALPLVVLALGGIAHQAMAAGW